LIPLLVAEEKNEEDAMENKFVVEDEEIGLTIDDTTEFVQSISLEAKPERRVIVINTKREPDEDAMDEDDEMEELEAGEVDPKAEEEMQALKMELDKQFTSEEGPGTETNGDLEVCFILLSWSKGLTRLTGRNSSGKDALIRLGWYFEYLTSSRSTSRYEY
jgi:hypothetical protein